MKRARPLIGATQGAVVAVAVVVVALTYLTPGDDPPLFGINAPGGEQPHSGAPPGPNADANRERTDRRSVATGAGERALAFTGRPGYAGVSPPPAPPARGLIPATGDGISPADDQYIDALARLEAELATGD